MYVSLSDNERAYFLEQIEIALNLESEKIVIEKVAPFTINLKSIGFSRSILTGGLIKYDDFLVTRQLSASPYNQLEHYRNLYEVFCYEAINKIKAFAKAYGHKDLRIYTNEDVIIEQLFNHKANLIKLKHSGEREIMACIKIK